MQSFVYTNRNSGSLERKLRSLKRTQERNKYSRKLKRSLITLRDVPANQVSTLQYRMYDAL